LCYRQALDDSGNRVWHGLIMPKAIAALRESGMDDNPEDRTYTITPQLVTKHLWGVTFAAGTEGGLQSQFVRTVTQYKPKVVAFLGDGATVAFLFPATAQAAATGKIAVWKNSVLVTSGITKATTGVTFAVAPLTNDLLVFLYEKA
jgi:hypothetical protein